MSILYRGSNGLHAIHFKQSAVTLLVGTLTLGLGGCFDSRASSSEGSPAVGSGVNSGTGSSDVPDEGTESNDTWEDNLGFGNNLALSDLPQPDTANPPADFGTDDDPVVWYADGEEHLLDFGPDNVSASSTRYAKINGPGVYSLYLRELEFSDFGNQVGLLRFNLRSRDSVTGAQRLVVTDQILQEDERLSQATVAGPILKKVYVDGTDAYFLALRGEVIGLGVDVNEQASVSYSIGIEAPDAAGVADSSLWNGGWNVSEVLSASADDNSCISQEKSFGANDLQVRAVDGDFFWGQSEGPYSWMQEFAVDGPTDTVTIDHSIERWLPIQIQTDEGLVLAWFKTIISKYGSGNLAANGDGFSVEYTQSYNLVYFDGDLLCSVDRALVGERVVG